MIKIEIKKIIESKTYKNSKAKNGSEEKVDDVAKGVHCSLHM
jgi:hypothetical protein